MFNNAHFSVVIVTRFFCIGNAPCNLKNNTNMYSRKPIFSYLQIGPLFVFLKHKVYSVCCFCSQLFRFLFAEFINILKTLTYLINWLNNWKSLSLCSSFPFMAAHVNMIPRSLNNFDSFWQCVLFMPFTKTISRI